jgi:hypothetical protein
MNFKKLLLFSAASLTTLCSAKSVPQTNLICIDSEDFLLPESLVLTYDCHRVNETLFENNWQKQSYKNMSLVSAIATSLVVICYRLDYNPYHLFVNQKTSKQPAPKLTEYLATTPESSRDRISLLKALLILLRAVPDCPITWNKIAYKGQQIVVSIAKGKQLPGRGLVSQWKVRIYDASGEGGGYTADRLINYLVEDLKTDPLTREKFYLTPEKFASLNRFINVVRHNLFRFRAKTGYKFR